MWLKEIFVTMNHGNGGDDDESPALMLILDVRMQWSSTHQMLRQSLLSSHPSSLLMLVLGHALDYRQAIDSYALRNCDLHPYKISEEEWTSISLVSSWLKSFRSATTQMSATKVPMLSTTHAIFRGLQDDIKTILCGLPATVPWVIKKGLLDAHEKLSDYYHKFDESPFYTWAARK